MRSAVRKLSRYCDRREAVRADYEVADIVAGLNDRQVAARMTISRVCCSVDREPMVILSMTKFTYSSSFSCGVRVFLAWLFRVGIADIRQSLLGR